MKQRNLFYEHLVPAVCFHDVRLSDGFIISNLEQAECLLHSFNLALSTPYE